MSFSTLNRAVVIAAGVVGLLIGVWLASFFVTIYPATYLVCALGVGSLLYITGYLS